MLIVTPLNFCHHKVAHVKAERDILAEADNEWVVKLYYSFQVHFSCSTTHSRLVSCQLHFLSFFLWTSFVPYIPNFQDRDNLYFVMDYIPGGDLMSLLIKFGIFQEELAQ